MKGIKAIMAAAALSLAAAAPAQDLTIVTKVDLGKGKSRTSTQYLSSSKVRTTDGEHDTIMEYDTGRIVVINHAKKEYFETSLQDMAAAAQKMTKELQGSPVAAMFGKDEPVEVVKGSQPRKIAGYDTEHWILTMGEGLKFELWAAPALSVPVQAQYYDARKAQWLGMGPLGTRFVKLFDEMRKVKGFPLATNMSTKMMMMKMEVASEATEVKQGAIPADAFTVPTGYKRKDAPFKKAA